ncbi:hypothetical protein JTM66_35665, partial [Pseudomonas aeruginosa]|nr:hypothetical protein [Pseudomonas aeruginosa]
ASSLPGISAIGECCEIDGQTWGLVAPCLRQAEVLADRLCGAPGEGFVWQDAGTRLKVTGIELFSAGEQQAGDQADDDLAHQAGTRQQMKQGTFRVCHADFYSY